MLPKINPTSTPAWKNLSYIRQRYDKTFPIREQLEGSSWNQEALRFEMGELLYDFSKNYLTEEILNSKFRTLKEETIL
jgi:hypothetical protein